MDLDTGFDKFLEHVGNAPSLKHTLDRIDVDGNYEPGNVRWATAEVQAKNTRAYLKKHARFNQEKAKELKTKVKFKHPIGKPSSD